MSLLLASRAPRSSEGADAPMPGSRLPHVPVLARESVELLLGAAGSDTARVVVDATVGAGGHAAALLRRLPPSARLYGFDRDPLALERARARLGDDPRVEIRRARLSQLRAGLAELGVAAADAILFDLGVSSMQLDDPARGFSFREDGPLDLRMAPDEGGATAADLVRKLPEKELADLIYRLGDERASRRIARAIVEERRRRPIERTSELAEIVRRAAPFSRADAGRIHPATRTFLALRLAVNRELEELEEGLSQALELLAPGGRVAVLAYHSLEDRLVKERFRRAAREGFELLTRKPIRPAVAEETENPRSRSARLRAVARPDSPR